MEMCNLIRPNLDETLSDLIFQQISKIKLKITQPFMDFLHNKLCSTRTHSAVTLFITKINSSMDIWMISWYMYA
jgi:hypothetical protein